MPGLMLIDGNSLTYRAFFALPADMATASGQVTNAVFGFTSMLINLLRDHRPDAIAVAFDRPEPTFRHERIDTYKANRTAAPDILRQQIGLVRQVIETLRIPILEVVGFEADDVIATIATRARDAERPVIVVTGDRDSYQLVEDPLVKVLYNRRGVSDYALYDEAGIEERTGVRPDRYVQYAALRGDTSDNLPGVPGVGEKTAAKLINTYGDLDGVFANLGSQTPKLRTSLTEHEENVRLNALVMELVRDVPLDVEIEDLVLGDLDLDELRRLFDFLEFRTLFERLEEALALLRQAPTAPAATDVLDPLLTVVADPAEAVALLDTLGARGAPGTAGASDSAGAAGAPDSAGADVPPIALAGGWEGGRERHPLEGIAIVTDRDGAEVAWLPARRPGSGGSGGRVGPPHRPGRLPRQPAGRRPRAEGAGPGAVGRRRRRAQPGARHPPRGLPPRPRRRPLRAGRAAPALHPLRTARG